MSTRRITREAAEAHLAHLARRRERYAAKKAARTPRREPEQLTLFAAPVPRKPTPQEQEQIDLENRNIGRAWIAKIRARLEMP